MREWTDCDGVPWGVGYLYPQAMAVSEIPLAGDDREPEPDKISFKRPPQPPYEYELSTNVAQWKIVDDMNDDELQRLLDKARQEKHARRFEFEWKGRHYRARTDSFPHVPRNDPPARTWWFVLLDGGPELRVREADPSDAEGDDLYQDLAEAAAREEAKLPQVPSRGEGQVLNPSVVRPDPQ